MRIKNFLIILAVIAALLLIIRYIRQVKATRRGYNFVSGGQIFLNWLLVIILVGSLTGIGVTSFTSNHSESAAPAKSSNKASSAVKPTSDDDLGDIVVKFKKSARLNDNGEAKVNFLISPRTKVTIKGHRTGTVFKVFKPAKGDETITRSFTFDTEGTYDIVAKRGDKKIVKHLKIKGQSQGESSSSTSSSSSSATHSSSSSAKSANATSSSNNSSNNTHSSSTGSNTAVSRGNANNGGGGSTGSTHSYYRGGGYSGGSSHSYGGSSSAPVGGGAGTGSQGPTGGGSISDQPN